MIGAPRVGSIVAREGVGPVDSWRWREHARGDFAHGSIAGEGEGAPVVSDFAAVRQSYCEDFACAGNVFEGVAAGCVRDASELISSAISRRAPGRLDGDLAPVVESEVCVLRSLIGLRCSSQKAG